MLHFICTSDETKHYCWEQKKWLISGQKKKKRPAEKVKTQRINLPLFHVITHECMCIYIYIYMYNTYIVIEILLQQFSHV